MDIEALRSFIAFVDTGSFTRAARQACRTQGAISMQMKKLEQDSGQTLFQKQGRYLVLTDAGRTLVSYARRLVAMHDDVLTQLNQQGQHAPIRIGCPDDYAESVLPDLVSCLQAQRPQASLRVYCDSSTQLRRLLDNGAIDLAILTRAPEKEEGYLVRHDHGVWVHGGYPKLLQQTPLPLILYEADCKFHSSAIDGLEKQGRGYQLVCATSSATVIKSLLRRGLGVSAMAVSSLSTGIVMADPASALPELTVVDIVLALGATTHPLVDMTTVADLSARLRRHYSAV